MKTVVCVGVGLIIATLETQFRGWNDSPPGAEGGRGAATKHEVPGGLTRSPDTQPPIRAN